MVSGLDLKVQRVTADVRAYRLAEVMGVSPSRVSVIEGQRLVKPETAERYLVALATLRTVASPVEVAS